MKDSLSNLEAAAMLELADRKRMALRVFRPMAHQEPIFEQPRPKYMLVDGGNRGGKTISLTALTTAIALDEKITFLDGRQEDMRTPGQKGREITIWLVCIDLKHIGNVLYPAFFKSGMFKVVVDPKTKQLRTYDPEKDKGLKPRNAPPFIPKRFVEKISWESAGDSIFNKVVLKSPVDGSILATVHAFTSKSDPPQGQPVDFIFVDEQLARDGYIDELKARLIDRDGQIVWSSWRDEDSRELNKYTEMIDREVENGSGVARKVTLTMSGNKHLGKKEIAEWMAGCSSEEERLQRDLGIPPSNKLRMYPLFDNKIHTAIIDDEQYEDRLSRILRERDGIPPDDWTKTLVLDPGTQHPAVLLCAVPPTEFGEYFVPYQEFYPGRMDPIQLAKLVKQGTIGQKFYRFIIDRRAGRQQTMGLSAGTRVADAYAFAFRDENLSCVASKHLFAMGSDDVGGRQLVLQSWMHPGKLGLPRLRIVTHRCPNLCEQLSKIKKDMVRREVKDERKAPGQPSDCVDALEYFAASNPRYVLIKPSIQDASPAYQRYMKRFGNPKSNHAPVRVGVPY